MEILRNVFGINSGIGLSLSLMVSFFIPSQLSAQTNFIVEYEDGTQAHIERQGETLPKEARESAFAVRHYVELDRPLEFGEHYWDEGFVKAHSLRGPAQIVVDLEAEQLYVYRAGAEIARTKITRGWEQYDTPTGVFPILEKDADHVSSTYKGAPMPYNLRLTWKGIAIHGAEVDDVSATHGCIGVPLEFARKLFGNVTVGQKVLVTRDWLPEIYGRS